MATKRVGGPGVFVVSVERSGVVVPEGVARRRACVVVAYTTPTKLPPLPPTKPFFGPSPVVFVVLFAVKDQERERERREQNQQNTHQK